jgi:probable phosphoglycerate mutase
LVVRHGESPSNVSRDLAHESGEAIINIESRDVDVPLSLRGKEQAAALGDWFASLPPQEKPNVVLSSPYLRALSTAQAVGAKGGLEPRFTEIVIDERSREKEFGILNRLTRLGI